MQGKEIEKLTKIIAKLPALGTRSARRIVLQLLKKKETALLPLITALQEVADNVKKCPICGNFDTQEPCSVCQDTTRDKETVCVVQDVADLWAMERVGLYRGQYHVLGGILSALDGVTPDDLNVEGLFARLPSGVIKEVILALPATIDGQITAHYLLSRLKEFPVKVTTLAQGIPLGAELDYMDDGTIQLALSARKEL
ncbi:MAG: recombination mediator RecR [Alphaproteobacteria bacterium]|nr:recombination mediator RecR [Alphaproteobacteria bacterium]